MRTVQREGLVELVGGFPTQRTVSHHAQAGLLQRVAVWWQAGVGRFGQCCAAAFRQG